MAGKQRTQVPAAAKAIPAAATASGADSGKRQRIGHTVRASTAAAKPQAIGVRSHNIHFDLTAGIAYHAIRELFFARMNRFLTGLQVLFGTGAVAALVSWFPDAGVWLVAASALAGVVLLVIDPAGAARDHRALRSRLHMIRAALEESGESEGRLRIARAQMTRAAADAPPGYRGVQAIAWNNAVNAIYTEELASQHRYRIGFWMAFFANWLPMRDHPFAKESPRKDSGSVR